MFRPIRARSARALLLGALAVAPSALRAQGGGTTGIKGRSDVPSVSATPSAQRATIHVQIGDTSAAPLSQAEVLIPTAGFVTKVGKTGEIRITDVPPGRHVVSARRIGYRPETQIINLAPGEERTVSFYLEPSATVLGTFVVRGQKTEIRGRLAEFEHRRQLGEGSFITREQIDRRNPQSLTSLVMEVRGMGSFPTGNGKSEVRVRRANPISDYGGCGPVYYIDGSRVEGVTLDDFPPKMVDGIEVYVSPAETPIQFQTTSGGGSGCGVIVIWTRSGD